MSKTFMSPAFLTKFLEEYRELPVLWQVRSADCSKWAKRDEAWGLLVQFLFLFFFLPSTPHSSSIITAAATCLDELILDTEMHEQSSESAYECVVKYTPARFLRVWAP
jgi:hypothetical protein